jgi:hypothetical protein
MASPASDAASDAKAKGDKDKAEKSEKRTQPSAN